MARIVEASRVASRSSAPTPQVVKIFAWPVQARRFCRTVRDKAQTSPLVSFQLDVREVKHMAPHVLSAAVASAGASRHVGATLWKSYGERAIALSKRLSVRDIRVLLQGYADASIKDVPLFEKLLIGMLQSDPNQISPRDLCSVCVALAKLNFRSSHLLGSIATQITSCLDAMDPVDLGSVVNAFSRCACCDVQLFTSVASKLKSIANETPGDITPAAATLTLNAYAVCSQYDEGLWQVMIDSVVVPRVSEFSVTQCALISNSLARCASSLPIAQVALSTFAHQWAARGQLERMPVSCEDLSYLADAFARLRVTHHDELNTTLAASSLKQLSAFTGSQLSLLCNALRSLPSNCRNGFLAMAARHAIPDVASSCSFCDLAALVRAFVHTRAPVHHRVGDLIFTCVVQKSSEAASSVLRTRDGPMRETRLPFAIPTSGHLTSLHEGLTRLPSPRKGLQALRALRAPALALSETIGLNLRAASAIAAAHAHFRWLDEELLERIARDAQTDYDKWSAQPSFGVDKLICSLSKVGALKDELVLRQLAFSLQRSVPTLSLTSAAECLLSFAMIGPDKVPWETIEKLWSHVQLLITASSVDGPQDNRNEMLRLVVAHGEWEQACTGGQQQEAMGDWQWLNNIHESQPTPFVRLDPPPPQGLLRTVFRAVETWTQTYTRSGCALASVTTGECVRGFQVDLLITIVHPDRRQQQVALEVDGPERFLRGSRESLPVSTLKHRILERIFCRVARVNFREWPDNEAEQQALIQCCALETDVVDPMEKTTDHMALSKLLLW